MNNALYQTWAIKQVEALAISEGVTEEVLMERAGEAAWAHLKTVWPYAKNITVYCGGGNNGGDGFVLARAAKQAGMNVKIVCVGRYETQSATARKMQQKCQDSGIDMQAFKADNPVEKTDIIVDAMLGTGLTRPVAGDIYDAVAAINQSSLPVLSLDVPTGVNADTGKIMGLAVNATHTITFIGVKTGLVTGAVLNHVGHLSLATLGLLPKKERPAPMGEVYDSAPTILPKRLRDSHKGMFGHVVIVGGNHGMSGAPRIAAAAALRAGAGRVTLITRTEYARTATLMMPEIMSIGVEDISDMPTSLESATVWAIGPGLGHDSWSSDLMNYVLKQKLPTVIDADGLRWLAKQSIKQDNWVLTPHPGEAAVLLGKTTHDIQINRLETANALQKRYGGVVVLKGAGSIIAAQDELPKICINTGNPGMASAGMGDCLTGIIAALIAQYLSLQEAAALGVWVHAKAGDLAAAEGGERGLLASDLLPLVRKLLNLI